MNKIILISILLIAAACTKPSITNYDECVAAGNPILGSYPAKCVADGKTFVQQLSIKERAMVECEAAGGNWLQESIECEGISRKRCEAAGGRFNECASACRNDPEAEMCTMQCVQVCQFGAEPATECPAGGTMEQDIGACLSGKLDATERKAAQLAISAIDTKTRLTILDVTPGQCEDCYNVKLLRDKIEDPFVFTVEMGGSAESGSAGMTNQECTALGGRVVILTQDDCLVNEINYGVVSGFINPNGCCVPGTHMTESEAKVIAERVCDGAIGDGNYNENSDTWWFNTDLEKEGCNPACVVFEGSKAADINWRCTGLLP